MRVKGYCRVDRENREMSRGACRLWSYQFESRCSRECFTIFRFSRSSRPDTRKDHLDVRQHIRSKKNGSRRNYPSEKREAPHQAVSGETRAACASANLCRGLLLDGRERQDCRRDGRDGRLPRLAGESGGAVQLVPGRARTSNRFWRMEGDLLGLAA